MPIQLKALKPKETDFEPQTLGQHCRKRRLELGLTQARVAERLGVNAWTVLNWEKGHTEPPVASMGAILWFLGYDPFPVPKTLAAGLLRKRRMMGWSIRQVALKAGVDPGTWSGWEHGKVILSGKHRDVVAQLLGLSQSEVDQDMEASWTLSHE